jgi:hypothetical protein
MARKSFLLIKLLDRSCMKKSLTTIFAIAIVAMSCSHGVSRVRTRSLPSPNPTSYSFPLPLEEVHARALQVFSYEHQADQPIFGRSALVERDIFVVECATNALFGQTVFRDPANAQDIYLHTFHMPFVISSVYRGRDGGLPFIATFHLHLTTSGSNTVVTITASDTEVVNGTKFGFGHSGPQQVRNCEPVKPTTVEEYSILRYLGRFLGITNMPDVILPTE